MAPVKINRHLCVQMTTACNMRCSFCQRERDDEKCRAKWTEETIEKYRQLLRERQYELIGFTGGEALVLEKTLKRLVSIAREELGGVDILIHTNGSLITAETVKWLNEYNISADVSIMLTGEKGLLSVLKHAREPWRLVDNVRALRNKSIHTVFPKQQPFADEVIALHQIFDHCKVFLSTDNMSWGNWTEAELEWLKREWDKLTKWDPLCFHTWCHLEYFSHGKGRYSAGDILLPDGTFKDPDFYDGTPYYENSRMEYDMPPDLMRKIKAEARRHYKRNWFPKGQVLNYTILTNLDCNLCCSYCYECKSGRVNNLEDCKEYLDGMFRRDFGNPEYPRGRIPWLDLIGGETLLHPELLDGILEHAKALGKRYGCNTACRVAISTNGTPIVDNPDVQEFLKKWSNTMHLSFSIDGVKDIHDSARVDHFGRGSYDKAVAGFRWTEENLHLEGVSAKATFTHDTIGRYAESVISLVNLGFPFIGANGVYEEIWTKEDGKALAGQMFQVVDYLVANNLLNAVNVNQLNNGGMDWANFNPFHRKTSNYCGGCVYMRALGFDKNVYGCQRFATMKEPIPIGKVVDGKIMISNAAKSFMAEVKEQWQGWPEDCKECALSGWCPSCSAIPYEVSRDNPLRFYESKPQCGWAHATAAARVYLRDRLRKIKGLPPVGDISPQEVLEL